MKYTKVFRGGLWDFIKRLRVAKRNEKNTEARKHLIPLAETTENALLAGLID